MDSIRKLVEAMFISLMTILTIILFGAFAGWFVGLLIGKTVLGLLAVVGITGFKMWQIGAFIAFVGTFCQLSAILATAEEIVSDREESPNDAVQREELPSEE